MQSVYGSYRWVAYLLCSCLFGARNDGDNDDRCTETIVSHMLAEGHGVAHAAKVAKCFRRVIPTAAVGDHIIAAKTFLATASQRFVPAILDRPPQWVRSFVCSADTRSACMPVSPAKNC